VHIASSIDKALLSFALCGKPRNLRIQCKVKAEDEFWSNV